MSKLIIFYRNFMNKDYSFSVGGIQSYIQLLIRATHSKYRITIIQCSDNKFTLEDETFLLVSLGHHDKSKAVKYIEDNLLTEPEDILIFASEQFSVKTKWKNTLAIQHGIYWDLPINIYNKRITNRWLRKSFKLFENYRNFKRISKFKNVVCVDYNYINWYRAISEGQDTINFYPILNCAGDTFFNLMNDTKSDEVKILFARRFVELRGVEILVPVVKTLIEKYNNVHFLIAGEGPKKKLLTQELTNLPRVSFFNITYNQMPKFMSQADIIMVPSLGSEGTSFSALEGMALGKAVIASNVGGLTNIIIDGYNGLLVNASLKSFVKGLSELIENDNYRINLSRNARRTAELSYTFESWEKRWIMILEEIKS